MRTPILLALLLLTFAATAAGQAGPRSAPTGITVNEAGGTTIVGEQDSAMGLDLTPWKDEYANGMDQAPSLYRPPMTPLDLPHLQRRTEYQNALGNYRRNHTQRSP